MTSITVVTVTLEDRSDGGLRVFSADLPGLILSGVDRKAVSDSIAPAIRALLEHQGVRVKDVKPSQPIADVIKQPSPRDLDIHVQHEMFIVFLANQARTAQNYAHR